MLTKEMLQHIIDKIQSNCKLTILEIGLTNSNNPIYRLTTPTTRLGLIWTNNTTITYSQFEDIDHHYQLADPNLITKLTNDIKITIHRRTQTCKP